MRHFRAHVPVICAGVAAAVLLAASSRVDAAPPAPGFQADLASGGRGHIECNVYRDALSCLQYGFGKLPADASCDFGGTVPTTRMDPRGRARATWTCVDEGFHDWPRLRRGKTFRSGAFSCTRRARKVRCTNHDHSFTVWASGRVRRPRTRAVKALAGRPLRNPSRAVTGASALRIRSADTGPAVPWAGWGASATRCATGLCN